MGDSGSLTLGYILGVLLIKFCMYNPHVMPYQKGATLLSVTLLIVPTFDVFRVIIVRLLHHKPIFRADKNHIHHKLIRAGLTQHQTLISVIALSFSFHNHQSLALQSPPCDMDYCDRCRYLHRLPLHTRLLYQEKGWTSFHRIKRK